MGKKIKLLALDVDGTLLTNDGKITKESIETIKSAQESGTVVIIASGRNFYGIPLDQMSVVDIPYVITTNGAAVYEVKNASCIAEQCLPVEVIVPILDKLMTMDIHISAFIDGKKRTPPGAEQYINNLGLPDHIKKQLMKEPCTMEDFVEYIHSGNAKVQKVTLNFQKKADGTYLNRDEAATILYSCPEINVVNGGFANLEMTARGIDKGLGLKLLAKKLDIDMTETMAIGDSENDLAMIKVAGVGVAMENAEEIIKQAADYVTRSNEDNGVAYAIEQFILD